MNRKFLLLTLAAATLAIGNAGAGTAVSPAFQVKITISNSCSVGVNDLQFPPTSSLATSITGSSTGTVTCTGNSPVTVGINTGLNGGAQGSALTMTNGIDSINYNLYTNNAFTNKWGDASGGGTVQIPVTPAGGNTPTTFTYYGATAAGQNPKSNGSYADSVVATVTF